MRKISFGGFKEGEKWKYGIGNKEVTNLKSLRKALGAKKSFLLSIKVSQHWFEICELVIDKKPSRLEDVEQGILIEMALRLGAEAMENIKNA